ncbi:hypothetical protein GCM10010990_36050 [Croceicoccus mobilis]|uniref:Uncharacterized protein n=1 Tax=Croceicoccus mobilis TaxID=1703339 RepID=A0A916ZAD2_9SPHN|nr:hypothetical protein GCM10010990_36050 [Croceicoccus mobilis]
MEGSARPSVLSADHRFEAKLRHACLRQRKADQPAALHRHEVDGTRGRHLGWNDKATAPSTILGLLAIDPMPGSFATRLSGKPLVNAIRTASR